MDSTKLYCNSCHKLNSNCTSQKRRGATPCQPCPGYEICLSCSFHPKEHKTILKTKEAERIFSDREKRNQARIQEQQEKLRLKLEKDKLKLDKERLKLEKQIEKENEEKVIRDKKRLKLDKIRTVGEKSFAGKISDELKAILSPENIEEKEVEVVNVGSMHLLVENNQSSNEEYLKPSTNTTTTTFTTSSLSKQSVSASSSLTTTTTSTTSSHSSFMSPTSSSQNKKCLCGDSSIFSKSEGTKGSFMMSKLISNVDQYNGVLGYFNELKEDKTLLCVNSIVYIIGILSKLIYANRNKSCPKCGDIYVFSNHLASLHYDQYKDSSEFILNKMCKCHSIINNIPPFVINDQKSVKCLIGLMIELCDDLCITFSDDEDDCIIIGDSPSIIDIDSE
ncbi:hypothetical protein ACTFIW_011095 [Dictyostelium discoideum]